MAHTSRRSIKSNFTGDGRRAGEQIAFDVLRSGERRDLVDRHVEYSSERYTVVLIIQAPGSDRRRVGKKCFVDFGRTLRGRDNGRAEFAPGLDQFCPVFWRVAGCDDALQFLRDDDALAGRTDDRQGGRAESVELTRAQVGIERRPQD